MSHKALKNDGNSFMPISITTMSDMSSLHLCFTAEHYMALI